MLTRCYTRVVSSYGGASACAIEGKQAVGHRPDRRRLLEYNRESQVVHTLLISVMLSNVSRIHSTGLAECDYMLAQCCVMRYSRKCFTEVHTLPRPRRIQIELRGFLLNKNSINSDYIKPLDYQS